MRGLELFCGAGGASIGIKRAGVDSVLHVDCDKDACDTLRAAGFAGVEKEFVQHLNSRDLPEVDIWWTSPPCPAWSQAGKRGGARDGRNGYPHLFRLLAERAPRWLIIEQVAGIRLHKRECPTRRGRAGTPKDCPGCYYQIIIVPTLKGVFPSVQAGVLDSANYGVPQHRNRLIMVCGPGPICWPSYTHDGDALVAAKNSGVYWRAVADGSLFKSELPTDRFGLRPFRTMRQVLPALRSPEFEAVGGGHRPNHRGDERTLRVLSDDPSSTIQSTVGNATPYLEYVPNWKRMMSDPDGPSRTILGRGSNAIVTGSRPDLLHYARGFGRAASEPGRLDEPSPTVTTTEVRGTRASAASGFDFNGGPDAAFLATGRRRLEPVECAILQDFSADYPFVGNKTSVYAQIGNAVPPKLAEVVVREVVRADRSIRR